MPCYKKNDLKKKSAPHMSSMIKSTRIQSIDILRGLVMVIMALEHVRDYFHFGAFVYDPMDLDTTTPALFMTRFITHFCAPVFIFLTGPQPAYSGKISQRKNYQRFSLQEVYGYSLWVVYSVWIAMWRCSALSLKNIGPIN